MHPDASKDALGDSSIGSHFNANGHQTARHVVTINSHVHVHQIDKRLLRFNLIADRGTKQLRERRQPMETDACK